VCFLNGGLFPGAYQPMLIQKILAGRFGNTIVRLMNYSSFKRSFNKTFGKTKASEQELSDFWYIVNYNNGKQAIPKTIQYMAERKQYHDRWTNALQKTNIPLRLINGPVDPISGIRVVNKYKELIENPDVVLLDGVGHYPQVEAPEKVVEAYQTRR
jgi:pimeloyl-ACP methyl ester carboxylesterase